MNRQAIIDEMRVLPEIDAQFEIQRRVSFIQQSYSSLAVKHWFWASVAVLTPPPVVA